MIVSVAREYKWPPQTYGGLFVDNVDEHGLEFWYEDVKELVKESKGKK